MKSKQNERIDELAKSTFKSLDKLEQRITTLERVIAKKEQPKQLEFPFPELRANVQNNNIDCFTIQLCNGVFRCCIDGTSRRIDWSIIVNYWLCVYVKDNVPYK